jgi:hypothetical protein
MQRELQQLADLADSHGEAAASLFDACGGELFPGDALAIAILDRSLNLLKSFHLLLENGGYMAGAALLRMQLDSVLRFNGVAVGGDPHGMANSIFNGMPLRSLKDRHGKKLIDAYLLQLFSERNPWANRVYNLASSYIHLSDQHLFHFMQRSQVDESGNRNFTLGDDDEQISEDHKIELINAFVAITKGVVVAVDQWRSIRGRFGTSEQLRNRFPRAV